MLRCCLVVTLVCGVSLPALAAELPAGRAFVERFADGWFWYERLPEPQPALAEPERVVPQPGAPARAGRGRHR